MRKFAWMAWDYKLQYLKKVNEGMIDQNDYNQMAKHLKDKKTHRAAMDLDFKFIASS